MQCPFIGHGPTTTSAAQRARAASARAAPPPHRERSRVRTCASRLLIGGRGWHVGARPCTEGESLLAGAVAFHTIRNDYQCRKRIFRFSRDSAPGPARPTGAPGVPCLPGDCASARTEVESPPPNHPYENRENANVQHVQLRKHRCTHMFHQGAAKCTAVLSRSSECTEHPANGKYMYLCERTALYMFSSD